MGPKFVEPRSEDVTLYRPCPYFLVVYKDTGKIKRRCMGRVPHLDGFAGSDESVTCELVSAKDYELYYRGK